MSQWNLLRHREWIAVCLAVGFVLAATAASAQTTDGETPATEDVCEAAGLSGQSYGLCNAYCEAMDCDAAEPQASANACDRVYAKIEAATGGGFPPCADQDGDGVPNAVDNCPAVPNADGQDDDENENGVGDACDCPCLTVSGPTQSVASLIQDAESFRDSVTPQNPISSCDPDETYPAYTTTRDSGSQSSWATSLSDSFGGAACKFIALTDGVITHNSGAGGLMPAQAQACGGVVRALQEADPFDICEAP